MCYQPTPVAGLVVGGAYYVLDRLADPHEVVTLVRSLDGAAVVRGRSGLERVVGSNQLSPVPADQLYRELLHGPTARTA